MSKLVAAYDQQLAEHAEAIREYGTRIIGDVIKIGEAEGGQGDMRPRQLAAVAR